ncbi:hypothetical protein BJY52DRAFT_1186692 [Lactarius psammicola]|nr:hypothetical protein BJY52DRAFT_1186692 [Lactarius psammicola]
MTNLFSIPASRAESSPPPRWRLRLSPALHHDSAKPVDNLLPREESPSVNVLTGIALRRMLALAWLCRRDWVIRRPREEWSDHLETRYAAVSEYDNDRLKRRPISPLVVANSPARSHDTRRVSKHQLVNGEVRTFSRIKLVVFKCPPTPTSSKSTSASDKSEPFSSSSSSDNSFGVAHFSGKVMTSPSAVISPCIHRNSGDAARRRFVRVWIQVLGSWWDK